MLLHNQQSTDGQLLYSVVSSRLKRSTVLLASLTYTHKNRLILSRKTDDKLYKVLFPSVSCYMEQYILFLMFCVTACKFPVVISTCTWQILSIIDVTMDYTCAHHNNPLMKGQSMQWRDPTSPPVVKFPETTSATSLWRPYFRTQKEFNDDDYWLLVPMQ